MEITVVIPTFRRRDGLLRALEAVRAQHHGEIVVVDNATPPTVDPVEGVEVVHERTPGASAARNRGIADARGDVVVFVDDDVVPQPGFVDALVSPIADGRADATGARIVLDPTVPRPRWFDDGLAPYLTEWDVGPTRRLGSREFFVTAGCAVRTRLLREIGGFEERLGPSGRAHLVNDDVRLCQRLHARGARLWYVAEAVAVHELPPDRLRPGYVLRRAYAQGRSDWLTDEVVRAGRWGGASQALKWLRHQMSRWRPGTAFHAVTDVARTAGALRQSAAFVTSRYTARSRS